VTQNTDCVVYQLPTKNFRINQKIFFFLAEIVVVQGDLFLICRILLGKQNNSNLQEHADTTLGKSHKSSHSTKPRLIQNYINAYMIIFLFFSHQNPTFIIPNHLFLILHLFVFFTSWVGRQSSRVYLDLGLNGWGNAGLNLPVFQVNSYMLYNCSFRIMPMISPWKPSNVCHFSIRRVNTVNA
jgi:hypothetical protein